jgi:hypothetical protein
VSRIVYIEFQKGTPHDPAIFLGKLNSLWIQDCSGQKVACAYLRLFEKNTSKAMMWKLCEFQLFRGDKDVFSRLTTVCWMLLPHNTYRLPQHYERHICGPSYSCKHQFLWISLIFEHYFCLNYMGTVHHWQPCWPTTRVQFIGQCRYFNPQWTPEQVIKKASCVGNSILATQRSPERQRILQHAKTLQYFR